MIRFERHSTFGVTPVERFEYWRAWYGGAIGGGRMRLEPVGAVPRDFPSSVDMLVGGGLEVAEVRSGPWTGGWSREVAESADLLRLTLFPSGRGVRVGWHGRTFVAGDGAVVIHGRTAGELYGPRGVHTVQVNVPRAAVAVSDADLEPILGRPLTGSVPVVATVVRPLLESLVGRVGDLAPTRDVELSALWVSVLNLLLHSLVDVRADGTECRRARRVEVERFVRAHLTDPDLDPDAIATGLHMSRRSLDYLLSDGRSAAAVIRDERLTLARSLLTDPRMRHRSIADVAASVGLPNASHFSRVFRAAYGRGPRETRNGGADAG